VLGAASGLIMTSCVTPAYDTKSYEAKVTHSAEHMVSVIASAQLTAELMLHHRVLRNVADAIISDAESDGDSVVTALDDVQPPDAASVARWRTAHDLLSKASDSLTELRIAERRHADSDVRKVLAELTNASDELRRTLGAS